MDFDSLRTSIRCFRNEKLPFQRCCTYITPITTTKGYPCNVRRYIPRYCTVLTQGSLLVVGVRERDSLALIDARRYAKLGGTRAEQTASIGSDFASVTGKQTNSSTPELRLGIDPKGVYSQLHAISSILPLLADHHRTRCALRETVPIIRGGDYPPQLCYQITRLQSLAEMQRPPRSTDVTSNEWLRAKPIHPSIRPCAIGNSDFFHDFHDPHDPPPLSLSLTFSSRHRPRYTDIATLENESREFLLVSRHRTRWSRRFVAGSRDSRKSRSCSREGRGGGEKN